MQVCTKWNCLNWNIRYINKSKNSAGFEIRNNWFKTELEIYKLIDLKTGCV